MPRGQPVKPYATWLARAKAALKRIHRIMPVIIPARVWKNAYFQGLTPEQAADHAATTASNVRPAADRGTGVNA